LYPSIGKIPGGAWGNYRRKERGATGKAVEKAIGKHFQKALEDLKKELVQKI